MISIARIYISRKWQLCMMLKLSGTVRHNLEPPTREKQPLDIMIYQFLEIYL